MRRVLGLLVFLSACSTTGGESGMRTFDLGTAAPKSQLPPLRAVSVRAPQPFDGVEMYYRLAYKDGAEIAAFSQSRWAAPPAELLRRQLVRALPAGGAAPCSLELEVQDFSQVFSSKEASDARVELRATLFTGVSRVASLNVNATEPGGANAGTGAAALARATDRAVEQLSGWAATQGGCKQP
ncbi:MAG: membrane integrity-associated transporter subunit PqiC [Betaproteobacteria bacterium]|nr:membrane integrity-associated transporter subunit PqiC [Betaproteobacteria bacterium]